MAVASALLFYRGMQRHDNFLKGLGAALAAGAVIAVVRLAMEINKKKRMAPQTATKTESDKVELFTKPKDF